jgi:hypothetical protein
MKQHGTLDDFNKKEAERKKRKRREAKEAKANGR